MYICGDSTYIDMRRYLHISRYEEISAHIYIYHEWRGKDD